MGMNRPEREVTEMPYATRRAATTATPATPHPTAGRNAPHPTNPPTATTATPQAFHATNPTATPDTPRRRYRLAALVGLGALLVVAGCTSGPAKPGGTAKGNDSAATVDVKSPKDGASDAPASTEIVFTTAKAAKTAVSLADDKGTAVEGAMRPDNTSWLPAKALKYGTKYTAKITATDDKGKAATATVNFTTMAKPANLTRVSSQVGDNIVYGVGMPMVVIFGADVAKDQRANVERRMFVTSDPAQGGSWNWINGHEVHFRPQEFWKSGTKLAMRLATGGLPLGGGRYGAQDINVHASIGDKIVMNVDNASKSMTVSKNDEVLRTMPVSLGKPSSPSSSGTMVIMDKKDQDYFDSGTFGIPADSPGGYRTLVHWPERLTYGGQFIHAAPWSVADQGHRNVSHGCANISMENAQWLYGITHLGDPVIVKGTERGLDWGDGWTDWNVSWDQYLKGSALHDASPSPSAAPS
jgi:lipoprotein-anchoring transpeptidase ErfK/SrfK